MAKRFNISFSKIRFHEGLLVLSAIMLSSVITGLFAALFLWLLDKVTILRFDHEWLIFLLPIAGLLIVWLYKKAQWYGRYDTTDFHEKKYQLSKGTDLIIGEIHDPSDTVPARLTPLILVTTIITHLFGGSAGREGTALQMSGGIAAGTMRLFKFNNTQRSLVLTCSLAAGFGAVFGTPWAGAVFAIEVLTRRKLKLHAFFPCLLAAFGGDIACRATGVHHTIYELVFRPFFAGAINIEGLSADFVLLAKVAAAAVFFGLAARLFVMGLEQLKVALAKGFSNPWLQPVAGGLLVLLITYLVGTTDYLGLGVQNPDPHSVSIISSFRVGVVGNFSWFWKLLLTVITLGFGFRGGEVTPLFFIGATLGNALAGMFGAPVDLFAAIGFIAVFAGATKTPVACAIMGIELFGRTNLLFFATGCVIAVLCSGRAGIYKSQRLV